MKPFEAMYVVSPTLAAEDTDKLIEKTQQTIRDGGGEVEKVEKIGRKKMAYPIGHQTEGFYVQMLFRANGSIVNEFERMLRQSESVLRFITAAVVPPTLKALAREKRKGRGEKEE